MQPSAGDAMRELPTGTVTFLFTDLESSTRLWEEHPDAMRDALARHDEILRIAVEKHTGFVVKSRGDGLHAVFATAHDAVDAAVDAQLAFAGESWALPAPLLVRMGLHTGEAVIRDDDYYGTAVNRAARIADIGHGGQIICSDSVEPIVRGSLPLEVTLVDLGEHRLRDLAQPTRVYQLAHSALRTDFPRLRSLQHETNLPVQLTSFVGRTAELAELTAAVSETRIVTLTGVGGVGKTRLALQVAAESLPQFPDGAWFVDLAPVTDSDAVADAVATAFGTPAAGDMPLEDALCEDLRRRQLLLLLDNCEHVLDRAAQLVGRIALECPRVALLCTSREGLALPGERIYAVPALAVPDDDATSDEARDADSVKLFVDRARGVRADFTLTAENLAGVVAICRRLDGVPLALELAAARVTSLHPAQIAERLDERFRLLTAGRRTAVSRHQTLRATIDWSYNLLQANARTALNRLAVFAGGCTLDAAEAVVAGNELEAFEVLEVLSRLVEQSLVVADESGSEVRYRLFESIRQYAAERLAETGDTESTLDRHAEFYGQLARAIGSGFRGPDETAWCTRYEPEVDNLRGAVAWFAQRDDADRALGLVVSLFPLIFNVSIQTLPDMAAAALDAPSSVQHPLAPAAMALVAERLIEHRDDDAGLALFNTASELRNAIATPPHPCESYVRFRSAMTRNDLEESAVHARDLVAAADAADDDFTRAWSLVCLGAQESLVEDDEAADTHFDAAARFARRSGNPSCIATAVASLAWWRRDRDPHLALELLDEAVAFETNALGFGMAIANRFIVNAALGSVAAAVADGRAAATALDRTYERSSLSAAFLHCATALVELGQMDPAAQLFGVAQTLGRVYSDPAPAYGWQGREQRLRAALGDEHVDTAVARGRTLDKDAAVELLREALDAVELELDEVD